MQEERSDSPIYNYATFLETNIEEHESWYTFIRYEGNEENIEYLRSQIDTIDWHCETEEDMYSAFDIDTDNLVSEYTAKEMTKLNLNAFCDHRKFDGVLECITLNIKNIPEDLKQKKKDIINDENIKKVNRILSYGKISQFLTDEDYSGEDEDYSGEEESIDEDELSTSDEEDKIVLATNSLSLNSGKEKVLI